MNKSPLICFHPWDGSLMQVFHDLCLDMWRVGMRGLLVGVYQRRLIINEMNEGEWFENRILEYIPKIPLSQPAHITSQIVFVSIQGS